MLRPWRRTRAADPGSALPDGWPTWAPVPGRQPMLDGLRARDITPTSRFPDVVRLMHQDAGGAGGQGDGWPTPVTPMMAGSSLCDVLGRTVGPIATPHEGQAREVLATLTAVPEDRPDLFAAFVGVTGEQVERDAAAAGWPTVPATAVQSNPDNLPPLALAHGLTQAQAVQLWSGGGVTYLWCDRFMVRSDPWGEASSSLIVGVAGTTERLRQAGVAVLPMGHAWEWPPRCHRCNQAASGA